MAENVEVVKLDTQPAQTSIKELRAQLKAYKDEMAGLEEGSDAFLEAANKAGTLKHQIDEITQSVNGASADFGDMLGNITKTTTGIIGGFQAAQGALTLFGVESEEVTKSIQKMQASMAVIQGLSSIDTGIKSLAKLRNAITGTTAAAKLLRAALTPKSILLLTAAVTAIIAVFNRFNEKQKEAAELAQKQADAIVDSNKRSLDSYKNLVNGLGKENLRVSQSLFKVAESQLDSILGGEGKLTTEQTELVKKLLKQRQSIYKELRENSDKYTQEQLDTLTRQLGQINGGWLKNVENISSNVKQALSEYEDAYSTIINFEEDETKATTDRSKAIDEYIQKLELLQTIAEVTDNINGVKKVKPIPKPELPDEEEDDTIAEKSLEATKAALANFKTLEESYLTDEEAFAQSQANKLAVVKAALEEHVISKQQADEQIRKIDEETFNHTATFAANATASGLNSISQMLSSFANLCDTTTQEGFEQSKKLQIASATMSMLSGIIQAWTSCMALPAPASFILAGIQTAATAALGTANINNIKKQTFDGSSTSGSASINNSAISSTIIPPIQYSNAVQGASTEQTIGDTRSYVAVTEIEKVSNRVNVAETESRY